MGRFYARHIKRPADSQKLGRLFLGYEINKNLLYFKFVFSEWPQNQEQGNNELQDLYLANYLLHVPVLGSGNGGGTSGNAPELELPKCGEDGFAGFIVSTKRYNTCSGFNITNALDLNFSSRKRELMRADGQSFQLLNVGMTPSKRSLVLAPGGRDSYAKWPVRCKSLFFPLSFIVRRKERGAGLI